MFEKITGIKAKPRTKQEIDMDYTKTCMDIGHKTRIIFQLQTEVESMIARLVDINAEAMALPVDKAPEAAPATTESVS